MIHLSPEQGVPLTEGFDLSTLGLKDRADLIATTTDLLIGHGFEFDDNDDVANETAATIAMAFAKDQEKTEKLVSNHSLSATTLVQVSRILNTFGAYVAHEAEQVRNTVVNKLLIETENPDPKVRLKALELVGKLTGVDLFTERKEVTIKHSSEEEIKAKLREKLEKLRGTREVEDGVFTPIDVDKELGLLP